MLFRSVPGGFCEVDVELDDNGEMFPCMMVSGHLAYSVEGEKKDTVRPCPSWFMFVKGEPHIYRKRKNSSSLQHREETNEKKKSKSEVVEHKTL